MPLETLNATDKTSSSSKAWYEKNRARMLVKMKAYREANREKILAQQKAWREANKEKIKQDLKAWAKANTERIKAQKKAYRKANLKTIKATEKAWYKNNSQRVKTRAKAYYEANKEKILDSCRAYRAKNKNKLNEYYRLKLKNDPRRKIAHKIRTRLRRISKTQNKVCHHDSNPTAIHQWLDWLVKNGHAENWRKEGVHLDHVIPLSSFRLDQPGAAKIANGWRNIFPLTAEQNLSKGDQIKADYIRKVWRLADQYAYEFQAKKIGGHFYAAESVKQY